MQHLATLGVPPPPDPHNRVHAGRSLLGRWLIVSAALWALMLLLTDLPAWVYVFGGISLAALAADVLWLSYRVRRDERRSTKP
jgi:hypothetical protein